MFQRKILSFLILLWINYFSTADKENYKFFDELNQKEYAEYMRQVVKELDNDKDFQNNVVDKKGAASTSDFIDAFKFVSDSGRNKLDEIKRREIKRLNVLKLGVKRYLKSKLVLSKSERDNIVQSLTVKDRAHLHSAENSEFTKEDLEKLISHIQNDLKMVDQVKEEQYRRHEWKKEWRKRRELKKFSDPIKKNKRLDEIKKLKESYKTHKKINEPGSEDQLKELWKTVDDLDSSYFDVKTFFNLHDLNQDGQWDIQEVESMVIPDIEKVYQNEKKTNDIEEKYHEIMKMRQHFMEKMDSDKDNIITYDEFAVYSKKNDFKANKEWKVTEESDQPIYTEEDVQKFEKEMEKIYNTDLKSEVENTNEQVKTV